MAVGAYRPRAELSRRDKPGHVMEIAAADGHATFCIRSAERRCIASSFEPRCPGAIFHACVHIGCQESKGLSQVAWPGKFTIHRRDAEAAEKTWKMCPVICATCASRGCRVSRVSAWQFILLRALCASAVNNPGWSPGKGATPMSLSLYNIARSSYFCS